MVRKRQPPDLFPFISHESKLLYDDSVSLYKVRDMGERLFNGYRSPDYLKIITRIHAHCHKADIVMPTMISKVSR